jgi:hypothetical protein
LQPYFPCGMQMHWHNEQDVMLTDQSQYHCQMLCSLIQLCYGNTSFVLSWHSPVHCFLCDYRWPTISNTEFKGGGFLSDIQINMVLLIFRWFIPVVYVQQCLVEITINIYLCLSCWFLVSPKPRKTRDGHTTNIPTAQKGTVKKIQEKPLIRSKNWRKVRKCKSDTTLYHKMLEHYLELAH